MPDQHDLPPGTYCICPEHGLLMPYNHVHWEWDAENEGCPVWVGPDEDRCGESVRIIAFPAIRAAAVEEEREWLRSDAERDSPSWVKFVIEATRRELRERVEAVEPPPSVGVARVGFKTAWAMGRDAALAALDQEDDHDA